MSVKKRNSIIGILILIAGLLVLDQITKIWAFESLRVNGSIPLIKGVLALTYLENTGAAWGMMKGKMLVFVILAAVITSAAIYVCVKTPEDRKYRWLNLTLALLVSGAIGNVIDRLTRGFVVDFISFELINFPIFNVADIYITCSAAILVLLMFFYYKEEDLAFLETKKKEK